MCKGHLIFGEISHADRILLAISAFRATHYGNIFLIFLQKLNTTQYALSIIQFSEADLFSVCSLYAWNSFSLELQESRGQFFKSHSWVRRVCLTGTVGAPRGYYTPSRVLQTLKDTASTLYRVML